MAGERRRLTRCFWAYVQSTGPVHDSLNAVSVLDSPAAEFNEARRITNGLLDEFEARWTTNARPSPSDCARLAFARLAVPISKQRDEDVSAMQRSGERANEAALAAMGEMEDPEVGAIDEAFQCWFSACSSLRQHAIKFGIVGDADAEGIDAQGRFARLTELVVDVRTVLIGLCMCRVKMDKQRMHEALPQNYGTPTVLLEADKRTTFQKLLLFVLEELRKHRYRRYGEDCWGKVGPFAWKRECTIKEFIHRVATKERAFEQWKNLTDPRDNDERCAKHLAFSNHPEFPQLVFDEKLFSFRDGVFSLDQDIFWPYRYIKDWAHLARLYSGARGEEVRAPSVDSVATQVFDRDFAANGEHAERVWRWHAAWTERGEAPPEDEDGSLRAALEQLLKKYDEDVTDVQSQFDGSERDAKLEKLDAVRECMEFAAFADHAYPTPELDSIFTYQQLHYDTRIWTLVFLGRLLYWTREHDEWQKLFFIKGAAQSGKSLIARLLRSLFPPSMVGTLGSNVEKQFGLGPFWKPIKKRMIVCTEVKKNFGMDQGQLQQAVSGEQVSVAIKFGDAMDVDWTIPFFFTGNENGPWRDEGGCITRRLMVIEFREGVRNDDCKPDLYDRVYDNVGPFLRKANLMYRHFAARFRKCEITPYLSSQIREWEMNFKGEVNHLWKFLQDRLVYRRGEKMTISELKNAFKEVYKEEHHPDAKYLSEVESYAKEQGWPTRYEDDPDPVVRQKKKLPARGTKRQHEAGQTELNFAASDAILNVALVDPRYQTDTNFGQFSPERSDLND